MIGVTELDILLSSLPKLEAVDLSYNGLSVVTRNDAHYVNPDFSVLSLASCSLTVIPPFLCAMKKLHILDLSGNRISGHIPAWAGEIGGNNLSYLDLSDNSIIGLPEFRSDRLQHLYLQSNIIQGPFPQWICVKRHLKYLDISNNNITGIVPNCLQNISSSLVSLYIQSNMIQGPFPITICNMASLLYLFMSNNSFHGVLPECLGNITSSLAMMDLGDNNFHGNIPKVYGGYCELVWLILNGNKFEGEVPRSLAKCQSLKLLDLGNNQLNGTFPRWLGYQLEKLQVLILRSNSLQGTIETPAATEFLFPSLHILDISNNSFVGRLPGEYFETFNAIKDVDKGPKTEFISGLYYYYIGAREPILTTISGIDLSSNKFEGEIPKVIGNLKSLRLLNLSHNNFIGQIPHALGNLFDIKALDLSWNRLEGEIHQSLTKLPFLAVLNLSQNHLVGRIPEGHQFNTFAEDTYYGNPGLCGLPLPTHIHCKHLSSPQVETKGGVWIYMEPVMLGLGCGTLLGLVWGYRMLSTGRPKWFNEIADARGHTHTRRKNRKHGVHVRKRT
ncbi:putative leucine-rich repeat domain superfamily [Helianthus annuus]|uniref:Leucine-rich repeat domain superfamily n=1 Tax=Helianthus annuus TaxID=4232 RepID=A0A251V5J0_HELAN|nr:receptor-like protein Cf-9 homolog [Helianthus annuus]KAF5814292.1 putative leucine-rich repeat domain superfamily [Helianthus annuus]KAJ0592938.1 putative leucine-rich repeat domain superfamily [Helianthus annuus]KAJ0768007.1 putative leucine-rich repeat domain superfamily [Helianthus annuus]KAJ0935494.1 putative leucine-rich repeat domain superfamily [Helianthus annuus]